MKKAVIAILAVLYIVTASGVVVNLHYCMGRLASVDYGTDSHKACGKCGMKASPGCCDTQSKVVKVQNEHQWAKSDMEIGQVTAIIPQFEIGLNTQLQGGEAYAVPHYYPPPDPEANTIYLLNNVFRI
jgi:hypothetical protein